MHVYIYDSFVNQNKFKKTIYDIETRLTDLGLNGKIYRLGPMQNMASALDLEVRRLAKSVVVVGNDLSLNKLINSLNGLEAPIGIIPVGKEENQIAKSLGIETEELACDALARRRIENLDLGMANNFYFLTNASIETTGTTLEINESFTVEIEKRGAIKILNLAQDNDKFLDNNLPNPQDGKLELIINGKSKKNVFSKTNTNQNQSIFTFKKLRIINKSHPIVLDNTLKIPAPVDINIARGKINMIVGKKRLF